jgi:hypothetical protein
MRIHIPGDWAVAISFGLAGVVTLRISYLMAAIYLIVGILGAVAARRGRAVPDGSTWVSWQNTNADGADPFWVFGTVLVLSFCALFVTSGTSAMGVIGGWSLGRGLAVALAATVAAWGVYQINLTALVVVFTPDKTVIVLKGRPFILVRRMYRQADWLGLHVAYEQGYNGGRFRNSPDDTYTVWGVYMGGVVELNIVCIPRSVKRSDAVQQIRLMVEQTAEKTGLPVPPWPADSDIRLNSTAE